MIKIFKNQKIPCVLCGKDTKKSDASLSYTYLDENGDPAEGTIGKMCSTCADRLDEMEKEPPIEVNDEEV